MRQSPRWFAREAPYADTTLCNIEVFGCNPENYLRSNTYWSVNPTLSNVSNLSCLLFPGQSLCTIFIRAVMPLQYR